MKYGKQDYNTITAMSLRTFNRLIKAIHAIVLRENPS